MVPWSPSGPSLCDCSASLFDVSLSHLGCMLSRRRCKDILQKVSQVGILVYVQSCPSGVHFSLLGSIGVCVAPLSPSFRKLPGRDSQ